jgi:hypothetical protein
MKDYDFSQLLSDLYEYQSHLEVDILSEFNPIEDDVIQNIILRNVNTHLKAAISELKRLS